MTQVPKANRISDFWHLIYNYDVSQIVLFDDDKASDAVHWPTELNKPSDYGSFTVELTDVIYSSKGLITRRQFNTSKNGKDGKCVVHWHVKGCTTFEAFKEEYELLMEIYSKMTKQSRRQKSDGPIVIQCWNGVDISGMFIALSYTLEKIMIDRHVDVLLAVIQVRRRRPNAIRTYEQYKVLHELVHKYANGKESDYINEC